MIKKQQPGQEDAEPRNNGERAAVGGRKKGVKDEDGKKFILFEAEAHKKVENLRNCLKGLFVGEISEFRAKAMKPDEGVYENIRQGGLNGLQPKF